MADEVVATALGRSHLGSLTDVVLAELTAGSRRRTLAAGKVVRREGDPAPHSYLVVAGVVRVFVRAPDGRTMTIRYCRSGALLGIASLFEAGFSLPASVQAVTPVDLLVMRPGGIRDAAHRHPAVADALLMELSERAMAFASEIPGGAFASVRQRVARHLLDLATVDPGSRLVARVGQQALADAVGTVREVVVRALRELRRDGLVETGRGRVVVLDPERLSQEAQPLPVRGQEWNPGH